VNLLTGAALATTPGGNGTVPQAELYTLANILAVCVNSSGPTTTQCLGLLGAATSTGAPGGTVPTDTATAAINIAHYPGANVGTLYGLPNGQYAFGGGLTGSTPPNDFTVLLSFSSTSPSSGSQPHAIAIDASGNAWYIGMSDSALSEFSPLGARSTFSVSAGDSAFSSPVAVAVDVNSNNVLVANSMGTTVTDFNVSSSTTSPIYTSGISKPVDVAVDGSGNIWVANNGASNVLKLTAGTGAVLATATGNGLSKPIAMAIEPGASGNVWVANSGASNASVFTNAGAPFAAPAVPGGTFAPDPASIAIDSNGYAWIATQGNQAVQFPSAGMTGTPFSVGSFDDGIAIDGAGDVWVSDQDGLAIQELNNSGTSLTGANGYAHSTGANFINPDGIAIDGSGNVWFSSAASSVVDELIGAGVPVVTPIAYGVAHSTLGTRP